MLNLTIAERIWPMREPFAISRGVQLEQATIQLTLTDAEGRRGRGEACGIIYEGETPQTMADTLETIRPIIEAGLSRERLLELLPKGGARHAVDAALWDLEAKQTGCSAFALAGIDHPRSIETAVTIGIRTPDAFEITARRLSNVGLLKIKVDASQPIEAIEAVRRGSPHARMIVDANQAWSVEQLKQLSPRLVELGVVLLEQPIPVGAETALDGYHSPVPLCADELIDEPEDLDKAMGRFSVINIKLDKTGGLTQALRLAAIARNRGFDLMVGCMSGSSLSMAPAMILAQQCSFVDLDGPLLQAEDWPDGLTYRDGIIEPPTPAFWG